MNFVWPASSRAELQAIERSSAVKILEALTRFANTGAGDVKALTGAWSGYTRIRIGDYRAIMLVEPTQITVVRVKHRSEIYR
ncbi:MAG: type II toxin-antitoxin system RelE/ParE family toxin [Acidobacteriota bacterium]